MLACEHGGMNEAMANLYAITGETKYLELARKFHHKAVLDPLERGEPRLAGLHGNTQIPKVIGTAREYELTGEERYHTIAMTFWKGWSCCNGARRRCPRIATPVRVSHRH